MRITHVIVGLNVGGAELMMKRLIAGLGASRGIRHEVISLTDMGSLGCSLQRSGIRVTALGMKGVWNLPATFLRLRGALRQQRPDVVQTWMYHADFLGGLAARSLGIRAVVWNVRNTFLSGRGAFNLLFRKVCAVLARHLPKQIIYVSHSAREAHLQAGYPTEPGLVIGNGFDTRLYAPDAAARVRHRSELGLGAEDLAVFSVGRCAAAKDHPTFIRAVCEAARRDGRIRGVLVGRDIDLDRYSLSDAQKRHFIVAGQRDDIASLLSAADMFCLHSLTEGFPNVLAEAMSVGLPCVVTRAGDAELILADARFTVDTGDAQGLAGLLVQLAQMGEEERASLGKRNRDRVQACYSLDSVLLRYLSVYRSLFPLPLSTEKLDTP